MGVQSALWIAAMFWGGAILLTAMLLARGRKEEPHPWLYSIYFFSGFPALIYQIAWQRALLDIFGVNIESVTIVVTAFMLGLGLGSLLGGQFSRNQRIPQLLLFGIVELGIGGYGLISLSIFHWVAGLTATASLLETGILAFFLVLIPTLLMGSTFPLLVAHRVQLSNNVGYSVGRLYSVNTLGSAMACFVTAAFTMSIMGLSGSVLLAAVLNLCVGSSVIFLYFRAPEKTAIPLQESEEQLDKPSPSDNYVPFAFALGAAGLSGFIALAYEIVWYRVFLFATGGIAKSFAALLGSYLAGIAVGSSVVEGICRRNSREKARHWTALLGVFIILANVAGFMVVPFLADSSRWLAYDKTLIFVAIVSALLGAVFPLIAHVGIRPDLNSGARLGYLYLSNIIGSAAGSFLVGFVLLDHWSLARTEVVLGLTGIVAGTALLLPGMQARKMVLALAGSITLSVLMVFLANPLFEDVYEKLYYKGGWSSKLPLLHFQQVVETRSGVIAVSQVGHVFGDGSWESWLSTDFRRNGSWNFLTPPYTLSALHAKPKKVLLIGLGAGAWAEIIANHPQVEELTIVEINAGYLKVIPRYPQVAAVLTNPKVRIIIDDGRRWLRRHPERQFDFLVMNAPLNWRIHASSLLSMEFCALVRQHLTPGGVFLYNTTGSLRAMLTGVTAFPYGVRFRNALAVSDSPLVFNRERWKDSLAHYQLEGRPVFDLEVAGDRERLEQVLSFADIPDEKARSGAIESAKDLRQRLRALSLITDDNMGDEWR